MNLKKIRQSLYWNQKEFAEKMGVKVRAAQIWEKTGEMPETARKLLSFYIDEGVAAGVVKEDNAKYDLPLKGRSKENSVETKIALEVYKYLEPKLTKIEVVLSQNALTMEDINDSFETLKGKL